MKYGWEHTIQPPIYYIVYTPEPDLYTVENMKANRHKFIARVAPYPSNRAQLFNSNYVNMYYVSRAPRALVVDTGSPSPILYISPRRRVTTSGAAAALVTPLSLSCRLKVTFSNGSNSLRTTGILIPYSCVGTHLPG